MSKPYFCAWPEKDRTLTLSISSGGPIRSTLQLTEDDARRLIRELETEMAKLPATVTAADLGIAAE